MVTTSKTTHEVVPWVSISAYVVLCICTHTVYSSMCQKVNPWHGYIHLLAHTTTVRRPASSHICMHVYPLEDPWFLPNVHIQDREKTHWRSKVKATCFTSNFPLHYHILKRYGSPCRWVIAPGVEHRTSIHSRQSAVNWNRWPPDSVIKTWSDHCQPIMTTNIEWSYCLGWTKPLSGWKIAQSGLDNGRDIDPLECIFETTVLKKKRFHAYFRQTGAWNIQKLLFDKRHGSNFCSCFATILHAVAVLMFDVVQGESDALEKPDTGGCCQWQCFVFNISVL